jgi:hypothetical protein
MRSDSDPARGMRGNRVVLELVFIDIASSFIGAGQSNAQYGHFRVFSLSANEPKWPKRGKNAKGYLIFAFFLILSITLCSQEAIYGLPGSDSLV